MMMKIDDEIAMKAVSKCLARMKGCWDPEIESSRGVRWPRRSTYSTFKTSNNGHFQPWLLSISHYEKFSIHFLKCSVLLPARRGGAGLSCGQSSSPLVHRLNYYCVPCAVFASHASNDTDTHHSKCQLPFLRWRRRATLLLTRLPKKAISHALWLFPITKNSRHEFFSSCYKNVQCLRSW
jgi:hypothetical protein